MPELTTSISDDVWNFLNKKGIPSVAAVRIIYSAWEMDGVNKEGETSLRYGTPDDMIIGSCSPPVPPLSESFSLNEGALCMLSGT